jgi:hypothetical protein
MNRRVARTPVRTTLPAQVPAGWSEEVEDPFGYGGDDLTLDAYRRVIESSVAELLLAGSGEESRARAAAAGLGVP